MAEQVMAGRGRARGRWRPASVYVVPAMLAVIAVMGGPARGYAQNPDTDIWIAALSNDADGLHVGTPKNVTARAGYDNHPWFSPDGQTILYSSEVDGQIDVVRMNLNTGARTRVTQTPEHEFSPMMLPSGELMVVRWAPDMSDGHLWLYQANGQAMRAAPGDVARIGYYAWGNDSTLAVFVNDSAQTFVVSDAKGRGVTRVGEALNGSPPRAIPGENAVSYLQQDSAGTWWITRLDLSAREAEPIVPLPEGAATNYVWAPDGSVIASRGNELLVWSPGSAEWRMLARFEDPGLQAITRVAVSADGARIAIVSLSAAGAEAARQE